MLKRLMYILIFCSVYYAGFSQKKWDGEGGDGSWENPMNWSDNLLPSISDDVVLDNSIVSNSYDVFIIGTAGSITCHTLTIIPAVPNAIRLIIPASNVLPIAFATTANGYSIQLKEGATFINASKATTGAVLLITDSMKIENGAKYIHRTPRGNAAILNTVSSSVGTERGTIEFDVPVASGSYIVSLTNRIFGTLIFSSTTNNGPITYTSNGSNRVLIRGDLLINPQVSFSVGFNDTIRVKGNMQHQGNLFNLSNNGNPTVLQLEGNFSVNAGSTITETNTAQPVILFSGPNNQDCHVQGNLLNEVQFKLQKKSSVTLSSPLNLSFHLEIKRGVLKTDSVNLLTLNSIGKVITDSLLTDSGWIDGPVRKLGMNATDHFLFPVGKANKMRWLELKNATGDFTVEFMNANPYSLGSGMNGINHISHLEYWTVESSSLATANVELSFDNVNSGGVTDISSLRVAHFTGAWENEGNIATTGSAGASGSVTGNSINTFTKPLRNFTLASTVGQENPLPLRRIDLSMHREQGELVFQWSMTPNWNITQFTLQFSGNQISYENIAQVNYAQGKYSYLPSADQTRGWYRIKALADERVIYSNVVPLVNAADAVVVRCNTLIYSNVISISFDSRKNTNIRIDLFNAYGQLLTQQQFQIRNGYQLLRWQIPFFIPHGDYFVAAYCEGVQLSIIRVVKK